MQFSLEVQQHRDANAGYDRYLALSDNDVRAHGEHCQRRHFRRNTGFNCFRS